MRVSGVPGSRAAGQNRGLLTWPSWAGVTAEPLGVRAGQPLGALRHRTQHGDCAGGLAGVSAADRLERRVALFKAASRGVASCTVAPASLPFLRGLTGRPGTPPPRRSAARNFSKRNFPARPRRAPPLVTPPAGTSHQLARQPRAAPRCRNRAPRDHPAPTLPPQRSLRAAAQPPPPGNLVTCVQAAEQVCWVSLVRVPARCTHPSAMMSAAA